MNPHLLALKACALTRCETVVPDSASDASLLLVELALHNRILRLFRRMWFVQMSWRALQ